MLLILEPETADVIKRNMSTQDQVSVEDRHTLKRVVQDFESDIVNGNKENSHDNIVNNFEENLHQENSGENEEKRTSILFEENSNDIQKEVQVDTSKQNSVLSNDTIIDELQNKEDDKNNDNPSCLERVISKEENITQIKTSTNDDTLDDNYVIGIEKNISPNEENSRNKDEVTTFKSLEDISSLKNENSLPTEILKAESTEALISKDSLLNNDKSNDDIDAKISEKECKFIENINKYENLSLNGTEPITDIRCKTDKDLKSVEILEDKITSNCLMECDDDLDIPVASKNAKEDIDSLSNNNLVCKNVTEETEFPEKIVNENDNNSECNVMECENVTKTDKIKTTMENKIDSNETYMEIDETQEVSLDKVNHIDSDINKEIDVSEVKYEDTDTIKEINVHEGINTEVNVVGELDTDEVNKVAMDEVNEVAIDEVKEIRSNKDEQDTDEIKYEVADKTKEDTDKVKKIDTDEVKEIGADKEIEQVKDMKETHIDELKDIDTSKKIKGIDRDEVNEVYTETTKEIHADHSSLSIKSEVKEIDADKDIDEVKEIKGQDRDEVKELDTIEMKEINANNKRNQVKEIKGIHIDEVEKIDASNKIGEVETVEKIDSDKVKRLDSDEVKKIVANEDIDEVEEIKGIDINEVKGLDMNEVKEMDAIEVKQEGTDEIKEIYEDDVTAVEISKEEKCEGKQSVTKGKEPTLCKLSNTLNILSDDEDDISKETIQSNTNKPNEKQCINIEDDDDIMLIDEDTNSNKECASEIQTHNIIDIPVSYTENKIIDGNENNNAVESIETTLIDEDVSTITENTIIDIAKPQISEEIECQNDKIENEKPLVPLNFLNSFQKSLADMTRDDLEEFCMFKIVEGIVNRSNLNEIKSKLKVMAQNIDEYKKKAMMLTKQNRDLQVVLKSIQEEQKKMGKTPITPLKITRSVGMQVLMTDKSLPKRKTAARSQGSTNVSGNNNTKPVRNSVNQSSRLQKANNNQIPVPRLVPAPNSAATKPVPQGVVNSPAKSSSPVTNSPKNSPSTQKVAEKRPYSKTQSNVTVDLTDDEPPTKVTPRNTTMAVRLVPPQNLMATQRQFNQPMNSPRKVYIPISGPQGQNIRPGQTIMLKGMTSVPRQRAPTPQVVRMPQNVRMTRSPSGRHPAPLPDVMKQYQPPNWKALPPAPDLKLSKVENGIVISWKIEGYQEDSYEEIASYQLYAYQETAQPPNTNLWKKIGDVKALPLPMACTLTQFMAGYKYYFAVRAVDVRSRLGPFSLPGSILLLNKM